MAIGDAYVMHPATVATGSFMDLQPGTGAEVIVHNVYIPEQTAVEVYHYDGTDSILIASGNTSLYNVAWHCTSAGYVRVKNVSGSSAILAADGMTTKGTVAVPLTLGGLLAWWDFSNAATLFTNAAGTTPVASDGDTILNVADLSTGDKDLSRASGGPTYKVSIQNGLSCARFARASNQYLQQGALGGANFKPSTVFYVASPDTFGGGWAGLIGGQSGSTGYALRWDATTGKQNLDKEGAAAILTATNSWGDGTEAIGATTYGSAGAAAHYLAGVANGTATNNQTLSGTGINFGAHGGPANYMQGDIFEVLVFDSVLSTADMNTMGNYLAAKWALTWTGI